MVGMAYLAKDNITKTKEFIKTTIEHGHPGQGVSMGQQAEAVQVLEGDRLPGRQGVAQRHGDAEAVVQIRPYPRCRTSTP